MKRIFMLWTSKMVYYCVRVCVWFSQETFFITGTVVIVVSIIPRATKKIRVTKMPTVVRSGKKDAAWMIQLVFIVCFRLSSFSVIIKSYIVPGNRCDTFQMINNAFSMPYEWFFCSSYFALQKFRNFLLLLKLRSPNAISKFTLHTSRQCHSHINDSICACFFFRLLTDQTQIKQTTTKNG